MTAHDPGIDDALWDAVADPSRRRVLDLLVARGDATPTVLAAELPFTRQAVTKHLGVLERAGLVTSRRAGREVRYSVTASALSRASELMTETAKRWDARLARIKAIAEELHAQESRDA